MDDALFVGGVQRLYDLLRDWKGFVNWNGAERDSIGQRGSVHQFHDERLEAICFFQPVNRGNVRMVQRGEDLCLALEPCEPI